MLVKSRHFVALLLGALLDVAALPAAPAAAAPADLGALLDRRLASFDSGAGVVVSDPLARKVLFARHADELVLTASLYKLAVLLEAERRVEAKTLRYDDRVLIEAEDTIEDGSFEPAGTVLTLDDALEQMITVSDNGTAHALLRILGTEQVNATLLNAGVAPFHLRESVEEDNAATPRAVATFFERLARKELLSATASERMLARLERQQVRDRIPAQLPAGTRVANKTGNLASVTHDAGIVWGKTGRPIVVVVMTWDADEPHAVELIQDVAGLVYANAFAAPTAVGFAVPRRPVRADAGRGLFQPIRVTNLDRVGWQLRDPDPFTLVWEMRDASDAVVARNASTIALGNVRAGASVELPLVFPVPAAPGDYRVTLGLATARDGALAPLGVATETFVVRAHPPFLAALELRLPSTLHRGEASMVIATLRPLPALTQARALRLGWRVVDPRNGRELARGESPLAAARPTEAVRSVTYLLAPGLRGSYPLELFLLTESGALASEPIRRTVQIAGPRTYGDELPADAPRVVVPLPRPDPVPRPSLTLPPLPAPLGKTPPPGR